jgi:hypothetical protein
MLPEHLQELLTAAVDGELSHAERRMVDTLLRDSEEARAFHGRLVKDAQKLRHAPAIALPEDLATSVMAVINDRGLRPTPLPTPRRQRVWHSSQFLPWFSVATAAVVLIAVSVISYLFFAMTPLNPAGPAKESAANPQPESPAKNDPVKPKQNEPKVEGPAVAELGPVPREVEPRILVQNDPRINPELLPNPRLHGAEDLHGVGPMPEPPSIKVVELNLSLLLPLKDLDQPYPKKQLRDRLAKEDIVHIDLFCKDSTRAAEQIQAALKLRGQQIIVDAVAQDRLKKRLRTEYVFFTESITAEEIAVLLETLGANDKKLEDKKGGEGYFHKFHLTPFNNDDAARLSSLLGVRRDNLKLPKIKTALDPRNSLEGDTASKVASTLPKGGASRNDRWTLLLPNGPAFAKPDTSKEIKSFLENRGERKPGTVSFMLVLMTPG